MATIVAALVLNLISATPLAGIVLFWKLASGRKLTETSNPPEWIGTVFFSLLASIYIGVAAYGLIFPMH
jgi:hypothetical protein